MMILRAVFWIALVSVFMPHEPDLGLGRPGTSFTLPAPIASFFGVKDVAAGGMSLGDMSSVCKGHESVCQSGVTMAEDFQSMMVQKLDVVRREIEHSRREREQG